MSEQGEIGETSGISRRTALKTGAALGVGAAAWAGPQIGSMGAAPAYAAVCTPGQITTFSGQSRNTSFNCGNPPDEKCISYKADSLSFSFEGGSVSFSTGGGCSEVPATYTFTGVPSGSLCVPQVTVFEEGAGGAQEGPFAATPAGPTGGTLPPLCEPGVSITGSIFVRIDVTCGPDDCF